jgi:glycerate kinase
MKLLVAFDSFKGSLTSLEAAEAFADGWQSIDPTAKIRKVAIADGGEGTLGALIEAMGGEWREAKASDPIGRPIVARYGVANGVAIIESATACGLTLLSQEERNPLNTTTYGLGEIIRSALDCGYRDFILTLGGSTTNDGGVGMLQALGYSFYDSDSNELKGGGAILQKIAKIDLKGAHPALGESHFTIASDVDNPLHGERGATRIYAPQKGADSAMVEELERGMANYAERVQEAINEDFSHIPGAGAAGGLGYALLSFMGATIRPGIDIVIEATGLKELAKDCDLIVTGEGRIDRQTTMGKAPGGILRIAREMGKRVVAVGGTIDHCKELDKSDFEALYATMPEGMSLDRAMQSEVAKENLRRTAQQIAKRYTR